ncbi:N5-carboxyaminoimidazole ribonucleotide synthase [Shewanella sp. NFH-SH190041]|uniref:5-(carboxyamino)imidazole ribonucleotide synthase n=1 Tax=Shewanella sp. NFH-SH190041 TaxID=2950245 RepID=UPI0021C32EBD|nr:5-(carboxyamino)imidazole ribonucleotide synthase [Shewanella sp. NFH-SH190041]BDM65381.1 N5-carboxyaminoimidazole ribonucleotide synthase [Shewanella sp. NFH-SH190041]
MSTPKIWVLGDGQLGAMMRYAGQPLALDVQPVDIMAPSAKTLPLAEQDIVTAEREQWPESATSRQLSEHQNFINGPVFGRLADRFSQKSLLDKLGIATSPWVNVTQTTSATELHRQLGDKVLLKRRTGGYDGKGQYWLYADKPDEVPAQWHNAAIAEQGIAFDEEVSLVGARSRDGRCHFYPLALNLHQDGILMASIAPLPRLNSLQTQAEAMLSSIMAELDYVGVMAMECFRVGDTLLVNELAPRVHNSGHWTLTGCHTSQFELHLRALMGWPIAPLVPALPVAMVNLIGVDWQEQWLTLPGAELFWYNKQVRPGRKVGHLNLNVTDAAQLTCTLATLKTCMPAHYLAPLNWLGHELLS